MKGSAPAPGTHGTPHRPIQVGERVQFPPWSGQLRGLLGTVQQVDRLDGFVTVTVLWDSGETATHNLIGIRRAKGLEAVPAIDAFDLSSAVIDALVEAGFMNADRRWSSPELLRIAARGVIQPIIEAHQPVHATACGASPAVVPALTALARAAALLPEGVTSSDFDKVRG